MIRRTVEDAILVFASFIAGGIVVEMIREEELITLNIHVSSPYNPEDGFTWRELDDTYLTCFPIKE